MVQIKLGRFDDLKLQSLVGVVYLFQYSSVFEGRRIDDDSCLQSWALLDYSGRKSETVLQAAERRDWGMTSW